jgi:lysophospholipase L1-like esterase
MPFPGWRRSQGAVMLNSLRFVVLSVVLTASICLAQQPAASPATAPRTGPTLPAESVLKAGDRIVFVGDSITGLGERNEGGFVRLMRDALAKTHPEAKFELVTLGQSGATVGTWMNNEARSRDPKEKEFFTDVPNVGVKDTFGKRVDVLVIMLGMNDILMPVLTDPDKWLEDWEKGYVQLVQTLRGRLHPRVIALGQCTMATEDVDGPTNKFIDRLNARVAAAADKSGCLPLPTNDWYKRVLATGRRFRPDFHVTYDYIHPTKEGQMGIAMGMLQGLGEEKSQEAVLTDCLAPVIRAMRKGGSTSFRVVALGDLGDRRSFFVTLWCEDARGRDSKIKWSLPQSWTVVSVQEESAASTRGSAYMVRGAPDRIGNVCMVERLPGPDAKTPTVPAAQGRILIRPPWFLASGIFYTWADHKFDEKAARTPIDDAIEQGKDFTRPIDVRMHDNPNVTDPPQRGTLKWLRFFPIVNYTGGDAAGNADFMGIVYPRSWETGYGARWVWSDRDRPVRIGVSSAGFTRGIYMFVWLNGKKQYSGEVSEQPDMRTEVTARLKQGWNCLAFRCCHRSYFYQCGVELLPADKGDALDDLRYSVVFKDAHSPPPAAQATTQPPPTIGPM